MKERLLTHFHAVSNWTIRGLLIQLLLIGSVYADSGATQTAKSLKDVKVDLLVNDAEISEVFSILESKSNFFFSYDDRILDGVKKVTIHKSNESLYEILMIISKETSLKFKQIDNTINVSKKSFTGSEDVTIGQTINITGKVTDDNLEPMPGVSVRVQGTTTGTITDIEGNYQINVAGDAVLVFSSVGFISEEISVGNRTVIDVVMMPDIIALSEIVVVGASMKERDLTGAVVTVNEQTLRQKPVTSINEALQAKAAGVYVRTNPQPGGDASIKVRGNNSLQFGTDPIYVVDGIVMNRDFNMVNLNDVASITVLKDASSTALYGSRGANGVILITTKKGEKGEGKFSYDGWIGVQNFTNESLTLGASDVYDLRVDALMDSQIGRDYFALNPNATRQDFINEELRGPALWIADYEQETYNSGESYNWLDEVTRSDVQHNHNFSFSGGSEKGSYFLSFGYTDQQGLMQNSGYKRYTGRINAEQQVKTWLKVGTNTSYVNSSEQFVDGKVFSVASAANPLLPINGDSLYLAWGNNWDINLENPLKSLTIDKDRLKSRIYSSNYLAANPIEGLNIRSTFSVDLTDQEYYEYIPSDIQQAKRDSYRGRAIHNFDHMMNYQWDNTIMYEKLLNKHFIKAFVGTSISKDQYKYSNVTARDFPTDDFGYFNLGAAFDKENFSLGSDINRGALMSYYGRVNYEYDNRFLATVTARYDGSSKFSEGHKWDLFPSASLAWNITNEDFMSGQGFFDLAKLRIGYGAAGNQNIPSYSYKSLYYPSYSDGQVSFNSTGLRGSPFLNWERQKQLNVGIDLAAFNNRVRLTAEYFNIVNSDLLMRRSLSPLTGYSAAIENIGEMTNKGVEFTLEAAVLDKRDLRWDLAVNLSADKNKVTQLYGDVDAIYNFGGFTGTDIQREGNFFLNESLNSIYMWEFDRIIQEEDMEYVNSLSLPGKTLQPGDILPKDQQAPGEEGHGVIDEDDRVIIGTKDPKFYGGFSSSLTWKQFSLNAIFSYSYGAKAVSGYYESLMNGTGYGAAHKDMLDRWTPENTDTNIPRATYDNSIRFAPGETSWGIQDASFLRLSTLSLAYDVPAALVNRIGLSNFRVYVSGNNLFCLTDYKGYDPENGDWYPTSRMFVGGVKFDF